MSWNYRVMRARDTTAESGFWFAIYEVYYDDAGAPDAWTERPSRPQGDTFSELTHDFAYYQAAFQKPVLAIEADGDELYEIGPMGNARKPKLVYKRSARPPAVGADP